MKQEGKNWKSVGKENVKMLLPEIENVKRRSLTYPRGGVIIQGQLSCFPGRSESLLWVQELSE